MSAVDEFVDMVIKDWIGFEPPSLTCNEAELLAGVLREQRDELTAQQFLYAHSAHDDEETDQHAGMEEPDG